jgi:transcriptional regulator with XRE-family HTH domain
LRRIRRYRQKHLATLLGQRSTRMVSQYETGVTLPPLKTALLLEIALGAKLSEIYVDLYGKLGRLAVQRETQLPAVLGRHIRGRVLGKD